jgi:hypothetical protein
MRPPIVARLYCRILFDLPLIQMCQSREDSTFMRSRTSFRNRSR